MKMRTLLYICLIGFKCQLGLAGAYVPFVPKIPLDPALIKTYEKLKFTPFSGAQIQNVHLKNYDVWIDERLGKLIEYTRLTNGQSSLPAWQNCLFQKTSDQVQQDAHPLLRLVKERADLLCLRMTRPETFFHTGNLFKPNTLGTNLASVEDAIEVIVTAPLLQNVEFSFFDLETTQVIRSAMMRIKFQVLESDFADLIARVDTAMNSNDVSSSQKSNIAILKKQALSQLSNLQRWDQEGQNLFKSDQERIQLSGRYRNPLSYENLPDQERKVLTMYIYAMMWRFRGRGFIPLGGTQKARKYFAQIPYKILGQLNGLEMDPSEKLGSQMFMTLALKGWGQWMDMGPQWSFQEQSSDLVNLSRRGLQQTEQNEQVLKNLGYSQDVMKFYSAQFGICYLMSFELLEKAIFKPNLALPFTGFFDYPTAWGEHCAGAAFGLGLAETLLQGRRIQ